MAKIFSLALWLCGECGVWGAQAKPRRGKEKELKKAAAARLETETAHTLGVARLWVMALSVVGLSDRRDSSSARALAL